MFSMEIWIVGTFRIATVRENSNRHKQQSIPWSNKKYLSYCLLVSFIWNYGKRKWQE